MCFSSQSGPGFEDTSNAGVAGCMTWHFPVPSPPPPRGYRSGYKGYRPNDIQQDDGTLVTTTTKTTVRDANISLSFFV